MNPLTQIANTQKATQREVEAGISNSASWHARFKHSAYVFTGGLNYELTEGDVLAVFSQYGEVVDLNLIRDKDTGKSKGFAFLAYEDQRSTVLAVDNLNGASVVNRKIRVEHVDNYKKRKAEVEGDGAAETADEPGRAAEPSAAGGAQRPPSRLSEEPGGPDRPVGAKNRSNSAPSAEPWAAPGSIFALMEEARQMAATKTGKRADEPRQRGGSAGPAAAGNFGPPRPPPRQGPNEDRGGAGPSGRGDVEYRDDREGRWAKQSQRDERDERTREGSRSLHRLPSRSPERRQQYGRERGDGERDRGKGGAEGGRYRGSERDDVSRGRDRSRERSRR